MDNGNIIIGSLPRSGSAWLTAALNTHDDSLFLHEATLQHRDPFKWLRDVSYGYTGIVGADGLLPQFDNVEAKRIYLYRDEKDIAESYAKFMHIDVRQAMELTDECVALGEGWCDKFEPYVIPYTELFEEKPFNKLWNHIFGEDVQWDKMRQIMSLNIQATRPSKELITLLGLT